MSYSSESITDSSEDPSFYSDPFKTPKLQAPQGYSSHGSLKPQKTGSPASARPYPASMKAYNRKDYKYISSFPRSIPAGLKAPRSEAELLNRKNSSCTDTESDHNSSISSTTYLKSFESSDGASVESMSKETMCLMQAKCQQYLDEKLMAVIASGEARGVQGPEEQCELDSVIEDEASLCDNNGGSDVGDIPCRVQLEGELDETRKELNQHIGGLRDMSLDEGSLLIPTSPSSVASLEKHQHKQLAAPPAEFGSWDVQNRESYTAIFDSLREERKKARGLQSQLPLISHPEPNEGLPHPLKKGALQHASPRRKWFSLFC